MPYLRNVPGWYGDETMTFAVSRELVKGNAINFSVWNTFWGPFYPYQPLYSWFCGFFGFLFNGDILGGRFFNALLALAAGYSIFLFGSKVFGKNAAFYSSLVLLTYFQIIVHYRMCYAHNAAGLGVLLVSIGLLGESCKKNSLLIGIGLGISAAAHPLFIYAALGVFFCKFNKPSEWIPIFLPSSIIVLGSLVCSYLRFGNWVVEDIRDLMQAYGASAQHTNSTAAQIQNITNFIKIDFFHMGTIAAACIFFVKKRWSILVVFFTCLILLTKNRANLPVFYYQAILITPTMCLLWAGLMEFCEQIKNFNFRNFILVLLWSVPVSFGLSNFFKIFDGKLYPLNQYWVTQSCGEVERAAHWLNQRTTSTDTLAANENIGWLLKANAIPYIQMITWYGFPTQGLSRNRERFRIDASLENVKYAVIGDIDVRWAFGNDNVNKLPMTIEAEKWPIVWQGTYYMILSNPRTTN